MGRSLTDAAMGMAVSGPGVIPQLFGLECLEHTDAYVDVRPSELG